MDTMHSLSKPDTILSWICRVVAAVILLQTLFFKLTGVPESVYIFTKVGLEPWGRIGSGVAELIAAILLIAPSFPWLGAGLALGVMGGAIMSHLTVLGCRPRRLLITKLQSIRRRSILPGTMMLPRDGILLSGQVSYAAGENWRCSKIQTASVLQP